MSRTLFVLCACALVFAAAMGQEEAPATEEPFQGNENGYSLLIARRTFMSESFVEGKPMTVKIQIWNIGTKEAMNVVIDEPYPEMFTTVEKKVFDKILATENVTYEYTVTPKSHGPTTVPRTHITYDDSNEAHIDAELRLLVESPEEYAKRTDRHIIDWIIYLAASVLAAGVPSFVFYKKDKAFK